MTLGLQRVALPSADVQLVVAARGSAVISAVMAEADAAVPANDDSAADTIDERMTEMAEATIVLESGKQHTDYVQHMSCCNFIQSL